MNGRVGLVSIDGQRVGILVEVEGGFSFAYDKAWVDAGGAPISLTMPVRREPYDSPFLHPFFDNLLPEGWLLELATSKLKVSQGDPFALLLAACADCVGAVEIRPLEEAQP